MKNNDDTVQELLQLQKKLEGAKQEKARMEGELKSLLKRLADDFGSDKLPEVEKKLTAMRQQAEKLRRQVEEGLAVLRKEMGE
jgi:predicted  nucleic acid-binding Zn-ribbon protein